MKNSHVTLGFRYGVTFDDVHSQLGFYEKLVDRMSARTKFLEDEINKFTSPTAQTEVNKTSGMFSGTL